MHISKKFLKTFVLLVFLSIGCIKAEKIKFEVEAPSQVIQGQEFRLVYSLENGEPNNVNLPQSAEGFEIIQGPSLSTYMDTQLVDGVRVTRHSRTYTYIFVATEEGKQKLPVASLFVDGKLYRTKSQTINVISREKAHTMKQKKQKTNKKLPAIGDKDAFIRTIVEKVDLGGKEGIEITFRLYTRLDVRRIGKMDYPDFASFDMFDDWQPSRQAMVVENYKGSEYYAANMRKVILVPLAPGKKLIPAGSIEVIFRFPTGEIEQTFRGPVEKVLEVKKALPIKPFEVEAGLPKDWGVAMSRSSVNSPQLIMQL